MSTANGHADTLSAAWHAQAALLAEWARDRFFVRTDRFGGYYGKNGEVHKVTRPTTVSKENFSDAVLLRHFRATRADDVVGAHPLTPGEESFGLWAAADIDNHDPSDDPERNRRYAIHLHHKLEAFGFRPLLVTWQTGGYHLWVFFDRRVPGPVLCAFGRWLVRDAKDFGYPKEVEAFPKQEHVPADGCGNWLRVPGRHHKQDVFASVYDGHAWVEGDDAVDHILSITGDDPGLIPEAAAAPPKAEGAGQKRTTFTPRSTKWDDGPDVFKEFNKTVSLDTVVRWHEDRGHHVTDRTEGRVEFLRDGKKGKGQSFNVQVVDGVPVTWNFSTNAGMPNDVGLSPAQVRCQYETGKCDRAAMAAFAEVLRKELGWDTKEETGSDGKGNRETRTEFPVGSLVIRPDKPRQTDGGKVIVPLTLIRDGKPVDRLTVSDSAGGRKTAAALIAKHDGAGDRDQVERVLSAILAWAVEQLAKPPAPATGDTVRAIVAARVPAMLRFTYRTPRGLWSEAEGRELGRADLMGYVPSDLLTAAAAGCDAPEEFRPLLGSVKDALEVLWADLRQTLKPAAELKEDTAARRAFHDAVVRIWKATRTWEVDRGKDRMTASRVSLAGIVQRDAAEYLSGNKPARPREFWRPVRQDVDAWWRPAVLESGECVVFLAMRYTLAEQVGVTIPEADNQKRFTELGLSYGVFSDTGCVTDRLKGGGRLSLVTQPVSLEILADIEPDPPSDGSSDTEPAQ
jgi:hypothetical protein